MAEPNVMRIEPGAAERIARAFDRHADVLAEVARTLANHEFATGFAGFPSAVELDAGFQNKRLQAVEHLQAQIDVTRGHAASIRAAGANYVASDAAGAAGLTAVESNAEIR